jgi:hypothetical protein
MDVKWQDLSGLCDFVFERFLVIKKYNVRHISIEHAILPRGLVDGRVTCWVKAYVRKPPLECLGPNYKV